MRKFLGYIAPEIFSLLVSLVMSFFTWDVLRVHPVDSGIIGEGFVFIAIVVIGFPLWSTVAFVTPLMVEANLDGPSRKFTRVAISFLTPLLTALVTTITMCWFYYRF